MAAGIATLEELFKPGHYAQLEQLSATLSAGIRDAAAQAKIPIYQTRVGSKFCTFFTDQPVVDYATAKRSDTQRYGKFFHALLDRGVYLAPSQFEVGFLSLAHTPADIVETIQAASAAFQTL